MSEEDKQIRAGVRLTNVDQLLFDGADVTKRELVDYLDAVAEYLLPELADRPLSVVRVRPGQQPFMQKNLPKYAPDWVPSVAVWAEASHREVHYPLCNERRTLLWLANQRAVEYHPTLTRVHDPHASCLVLDLDPPPGDNFAPVVRAAELVRAALAEIGLAGAVKTSGAKGVHVFVPLEADTALGDAAAATRALAARAERLDPGVATTAFIRADRAGKVFLDPTRSGGATVVSVYSPRARPGVPVSFPLRWEDLAQVTPSDFTVRTAAASLRAGSRWRDLLPPAQALSTELVAEGHAIPIPRVQAMHEGKRRARERRLADEQPG
ncbi:MAG TPA: ATP-dependent DNA ligase [Pseudonocardia sp.]|jgi:DNA ligase D-like protein (predicted polymerase)|uniref:DNA polymerase domain-containing protein n=1 Tax=Pseudonocardia sp. TaxID=60912 RepID=UPI002F42FD68